MAGTSNATATNRDGVSYSSWFNLNPLQGVPAWNGGVAIPNPLNDKIGVRSSTVYMDFLNSSSLPIFMKIHYFMAKQDCDDDPFETFNSSIATENMYSTDYIVPSTEIVPTASGDEACVYTAATTTAPASLETLPYTNLLSKRLTKSTWKKLKTKSYSMAAGDTMRVTTVCSNNQFGLRERLSTVSGLYPKGCVCMVIEVQGTAAVVQDHAGVSGAPAVYSGGALTWVATRKVSLSVLKSPNQRFNTTYVGQGTVLSNSTIGNSVVIGENTLVADLGNTIY